LHSGSARSKNAATLGAIVPDEWAGVPSIARVADVVLAAVPPSPTRHLILLAVDGVAARIAEEAWGCDELVVLRSTIPTTSTTAWLTAFTGVAVEAHLVPGMVFRVRAEEGLVNATTTRHGDHWAAALIPDLPTVFSRLKRRGVASLACLGALTACPGPWRDAVLRDATPVRSRRFPTLAPEPARAAAAAIADVEDALREPLGDCSVICAYVDLDTSVHARGYDDGVVGALIALEEAARRWVRRGATVLAVSDHGLTPVSPARDAVEGWKMLETSSLCRGPAGGAGRIRWLYAAPGCGPEVLGKATALLAERADVYDTSMLCAGATLRERLGDVIAVARDPAFPLPRGHGLWNHGATEAEELLVPFGRWGPLERGGQLGRLLASAPEGAGS